jgi:competence ComEA-like helix-hairpin-helix protein
MIASGFLALALCAIAVPLATGPEGLPKETRRTAEAPATAIDINRATVEDFSKLPGIGPKLAQRIVAFREKHGPFRRVEDLLAIRGIGHKKWKKIRPYLRVGNDGSAK